MPLEIKELYVKVSVNDGNPQDNSNSTGQGQENKEAIIQMCVERVLEILKRKSER